jgi:hypothetical protein
MSGHTEEIPETEWAVSGFEVGVITITAGVSFPKDDDALKVIQLEKCMLMRTLTLHL